MGRAGRRLDEKLQVDTAEGVRDGTVQEAAIHIRNGRHVLPVKRRNPRGNLEGHRSRPVRRRGATLFVEPMSTVELNNELVETRVRREEGDREDPPRTHRGGRASRREEIGRLDSRSWANSILRDGHGRPLERPRCGPSEP